MAPALMPFAARSAFNIMEQIEQYKADAKALVALSMRQTALSCDSPLEQAQEDFQRVVAALTFYEEIGLIQITQKLQENATGKRFTVAATWQPLLDLSPTGLKDNIARKIVLRYYYSLHYSARYQGRPVRPDLGEFGGVFNDDRLYSLSAQLGEAGLLDWNAGAGSARITAKGIDVFEGAGTEAIAFNHIDNRQYHIARAANIQIGDGNALNMGVNADALASCWMPLHRRVRIRSRSSTRLRSCVTSWPRP